MERLIKTEADYNNALTIIDELMDREGADRDSERLEYWVKLVEFYEDEHYPIAKPTPLSAIQFAMERLELSRRDLEPYIGNKSKVSEVLSGKRPLTLEMIRRLHAALGIPLDTLAQDVPAQVDEIDWSRFPVREMTGRGWLPAAAGAEAATAVQGWFARAGLHTGELAHCARSSTRLGTRGDAYGMLAWVSGVRILSAAQDIPGTYDRAALTETFFHDLFALSPAEGGPLRAREYLAGFGIHLIVLRHFAKTYMDGAALYAPNGNAVVGLTLRHDRLDNFWFTLAHELSHLAKGHVEPGCFVVDDLETRSQDAIEHEANALATAMMIPREVWEATPPSGRATLDFVLSTARTLKISSAIVAGRVRNETRNFKQFSKIVGSGTVRDLFSEWAD